jgi:hypothetical protein
MSLRKLDPTLILVAVLLTAFGAGRALDLRNAWPTAEAIQAQ